MHAVQGCMDIAGEVIQSIHPTMENILRGRKINGIHKL